MQTSAITRGTMAAADIDWDLLLLLARTEAALTWPETAGPADGNPALPDGLDLRHGADLDWVSRVVTDSAASRRVADGGPYSRTK